VWRIGLALTLNFAQHLGNTQTVGERAILHQAQFRYEAHMAHLLGDPPTQEPAGALECLHRLFLLCGITHDGNPHRSTLEIGAYLYTSNGCKADPRIFQLVLNYLTEDMLDGIGNLLKPLFTHG